MKTLYHLFIIFLLCGGGAGCSEKKKLYHGHIIAVDSTIPVIIHSSKFTFEPGNVAIYNPDRYFYITYQTTFKNQSQSDYGEVLISCKGFPQKTWIDSGIFSRLENKRSCYQNIILTSIYEFRNKEDYNSFMINYKGDKPTSHKKTCEQKDLFYHSPKYEFKIDTSNLMPFKDTTYTRGTRYAIDIGYGNDSIKKHK